MKILKVMLVLLAMLGLCLQSGYAAEKTEAEHKDETAKKEESAEKALPPGEYDCKYYTVKLPEGWTAVMPPKEHVSTVNAIFATDMGGTVVTMIIGPSGGADLQTIAEMFAEQFKAIKPPVLKNGQYSFLFPLQGATAEAFISSLNDVFMVTTMVGNAREAKNFLKNSVRSEKWESLFPK